MSTTISIAAAIDWVAQTKFTINWQKLESEKMKIFCLESSVYESTKKFVAFLLSFKEDKGFEIKDLLDKYHLNGWGVYCGVTELVKLGFIVDESVTENAVASKSSYSTYIYLMHDTTNNFYKIGKSRQPTYREKTFQSEKPTVELLFAWEGEPQEEKDLHKKFSEKRIRGEWFSLAAEDVEFIKHRFSNRSELLAIEE